MEHLFKKRSISGWIVIDIEVDEAPMNRLFALGNWLLPLKNKCMIMMKLFKAGVSSVSFDHWWTGNLQYINHHKASHTVKTLPFNLYYEFMNKWNEGRKGRKRRKKEPGRRRRKQFYLRSQTCLKPAKLIWQQVTNSSLWGQASHFNTYSNSNYKGALAGTDLEKTQSRV